MRLLSSLLALPLALAACTPPSQNGAPAPAPLSGPTSCGLSRPEAPSEVARQVNELRARQGLAPLRLNGTLSRIAQNHACDNAARNSYSHEGSQGSTLGSRLATGGYRHLGARENTGLGRFDSTAMMSYWRNSPQHLENLRAPQIDEMGLGVAATGDGRNAWVLVLAKRR